MEGAELDDDDEKVVGPPPCSLFCCLPTEVGDEMINKTKGHCDDPPPDPQTQLEIIIPEDEVVVSDQRQPVLEEGSLVFRVVGPGDPGSINLELLAAPGCWTNREIESPPSPIPNPVPPLHLSCHTWTGQAALVYYYATLTASNTEVNRSSCN